MKRESAGARPRRARRQPSREVEAPPDPDICLTVPEGSCRDHGQPRPARVRTERLHLDPQDGVPTSDSAGVQIDRLRRRTQFVQTQ